ncbi:hypothetical protein PHYBOEH_004705 [Phytophthora boehmeriae]|uniref:Uncharacterized protein n=1 Tax=Phytophthora boehmeriae TaxID=109152 RepID=A0A8T1WMY6_9STRA|nr:hypothetical protein PHYBOEH_004705 [Phytophthora boehmeriae]
MASVEKALSLIATILFCIMPPVYPHGYLSFPAAVYRNPYTATSFVATITESVDPIVFGGKKWNDSPELNSVMFATAFHNSSYASLRALLDPVVTGCGSTRIDISPINVTGATEMHWQNDQEHKGFVDSHHGPCEAWIDDHRVLHDNDCRATYTSYPARLPVDYEALCDGECSFTFYWLALHEPTWQVYKACAPIVTGIGL